MCIYFKWLIAAKEFEIEKTQRRRLVLGAKQSLASWSMGAKYVASLCCVSDEHGDTTCQLAPLSRAGLGNEEGR